MLVHLEARLLLVAALVEQVDAYTGVQKRQLAQSLGEGLVVEFEHRENFRIRHEADSGSGGFTFAHGLDRLFRHAPVIDLMPDFAVAANFEL